MPRSNLKQSLNKKRGTGGRGSGKCGVRSVLICGCVSLALYLFVTNRHATTVPSKLLLLDSSGTTTSAQQTETKTTQKAPETTTSTFAKADNPSSNNHQVAGLSCDAYGGPDREAAAEMVYWRDIPSDAKFESPYKHVGPQVKYLTFEPDEGGWNNIRMAMETAVTMALAMGRTLVLPPEQEMYLLRKNDKGQKNRFTFKDFFHFDSVELEHPGLQVITFEEFLKREAMTGNLKDPNTGEPSFPPENRTNWDGVLVNFEAGKKGVFPWLRKVTKTVNWDWDKCLAGFPAEAGPEGAQRLQNTFDEAKEKIKGIADQQRIKSFTNNPTPVDAPAEARIREQLATRKHICIYDGKFQQAKFVHLMGDNDSGARMLAHFYVFLLFEDWRHDQWIKRFVRDHLRYVDQIQCVAAKYVEFLRSKARQFGDPSGNFYTMHIRRGDFQYKDTRVEADVIFNNVRDVIPVNSTLYIATDEKNRGFFDIFSKNYRVYFLDSNPALHQGLNSNYFGMLDQLIASKGKVFVGTFYSTFTGYINRMRGYHSQKEKLPGYEKGELESYYYVPLNNKFSVKEYRSVHPPYWSREFPVGWRDIDKSAEGIVS